MSLPNESQEKSSPSVEERSTKSAIENLKDLASAAQSIAVVLGLLTGGAWAYFKYIHLESPEAQQALLESKKFGSLDISISHDQVKITGTDRFISARIRVKNIGDGVVWLELQPDPILLIQVKPDENGNVDYTNGVGYPIITNPEINSGSRTLMPNRQIDFLTVMKISNPGFYLVSFTANANPAKGANKEFRHVWEQGAIIFVE